MPTNNLEKSGHIYQVISRVFLLYGVYNTGTLYFQEITERKTSKPPLLHL